jgi:hypothetical protein
MAVLLLVLSLVGSACWQIRYLSYWPKSLSMGDVAKVKVNLFPLSISLASNTYVVVLIGHDSTLSLDSVSSFDMLGNWGGPYTSSQLAPLETLLLSGGTCLGAGVDAADVEASGTYTDWYAFRSNDKIDGTGIAAADLGTPLRVNIKVERSGGASNGYGGLVIFTGAWADNDNDGVPEGGEVVCTGMLTLTIPFQA